MLCINTFCIFFKVEGEKVRRIIISDKEGPKFSAKFVDFQTTGLLTGDSLRKIPAIMNNMPPAALTAARLNASTRDTFILLGQLLSMAVADSALMLSPKQLHVKIVQTQKGSRDGGDSVLCNLPEICLQLQDLTGLARMDKTELTDLRNNLVRRGLYNHSIEIPNVCQDNQMDCNEFNFLEDFVVKDADYVNSPEPLTRQTLDANAKDVKVHENLPNLVLDKRESFTVISTSSDYCTLVLNRGKDALQELFNKETSLPVEFECQSKTLAVYSETDQCRHRCYVVEACGDDVEIYLVDLGRTLFCQPSELSALPAALATLPASVIHVKTPGQKLLKVGQILDATVVFNDGGWLQLDE